MKAMAIVDSNWGIGNKGKLLVHIPGDMKAFKAMTLEKIVIMGRNTLESLPGKQPLIDRVNIVLSRDLNYDRTDTNLITCHSIGDLINILKGFDTNDVYIIGGQEIYNQFLPFCSVAYITKINKEYKADKHLMRIDEQKNWKLAWTSEVKYYKDIQYKSLRYTNKDYINILYGENKL